MDFDHVRPDHSCFPIEKIVEKHRKALQGCCDVLKEKQAKGEKSLKVVADAEKALKQAAMQAKAELSKEKDDIQQAVEDVFQKRINTVDELCASKEKVLAKQRNDVESFLKKVKCAGDLSKNVLKTGSDEEIIESRKLVEERVEMVNESENLKEVSDPNSPGQTMFPIKKVDIGLMVSVLFGAGTAMTIAVVCITPLIQQIVCFWLQHVLSIKPTSFGSF